MGESIEYWENKKNSILDEVFSIKQEIEKLEEKLKGKRKELSSVRLDLENARQAFVRSKSKQSN